MRERLRTWYPLLLALAGVGLSLAVYDRLPAAVGVHFDASGNPNGWMPRRVGAFFAPAMLLGFWAFFAFIRRIDSSSAGDRFGDAYETIVASVLLLMFSTHAVVIATALGYPVPVARLAPVFMGLLFVVIGRAMGRTRPNWWMGVRTPWTLASEGVWTRTHRLAGHAMIGAGVVMLVAALALPTELGLPIVVAAAVASTIGPILYSYLTWRREQRQRDMR